MSRNSRSNRSKGADTKVADTKSPGGPLQDIDNNQSEDYEVEAIIGDRKSAGKIQFLVLWKGFAQDEATWEEESHLSCNQLIAQYRAKKDRSEDVNDEPTSSLQTNSSPKKKTAKRSPVKNSENQLERKAMKLEHPEANADGEYKIKRIVDVHLLKNGKREFLVKWVGYSSEENTWEPEKNLEGTEVLEKFLAKLEKVRELSQKELRVKRKPTDRYTVTPQGNKLRHSKRYDGKQRVKYHDAE